MACCVPAACYRGGCGCPCMARLVDCQLVSRRALCPLAWTLLEDMPGVRVAAVFDEHHTYRIRNVYVMLVHADCASSSDAP
jgi:hypothetical protein